ncbi:hypothetical protein SAMN05421837_107129 [Amycolatopsis pretoriensis]|uniref:Uncharacterized protein n=1 Tax=Amycolatopsis pretoriensis TaxID=218821 RepID=A0A1H5R693_9PSEU|nr:hypothetical protein [Amycolatopsis pretoriensis]SEF33960.1 hypothetical protein SAMN05421837_107129 [Amycolatopsis pretoriensis]
MTTIDVDLARPRPVGKTSALSIDFAWPPLADLPPSLLPPGTVVQLSTGSGKTATALQIMSEFFRHGFSEWLAANGLASPESSPQKPCDCPACAEFTATARCGRSSDEFGERLSFESWAAAPAALAAPHVTALMDAPAMAIAAVLDEWTDAVFDRAHQTAEGTAARVTAFHLVSPWILLVHRLLVLSWRTGAVCASLRGLARIRRRSRDLCPANADGTRPRCAGRAPRGPSAPRMSSMVIRGGAQP